jgi:hypothetical protein
MAPDRRLPKLALALLVSAGAFAADLSRACSCTNPLTVSESVQVSAAVFTGRVTSVETGSFGVFGTKRVQLELLLYWKGSPPETVTLYTEENEGVCGANLQLDGEYLVYALGVTDGVTTALYTHLCTRTAPAAGNPDLSELGTPQGPTPTRPPSWGAIKSLYR